MHLFLLPLLTFLHLVTTPSAIVLKGYFTCSASLIQDTGDGLSVYARTQHGCRYGEVILAAQKRLSKREDNPVFAITDTLHLRMNPTLTLSIARCTTTNGKTRQYFVLSSGTPSDKEYLRNIKRVWGMNAQYRLVPVPVKTIKCFNNDYGA